MALQDTDILAAQRGTTTYKVPASDLKSYAAGGVPDASETVKGIVELATSAEASTGTSTVLAVHPAGLTAAINARADLVGTAAAAIAAHEGAADPHPQYATVLNELGDVTIAAPASGQVLAYTGTGWVNQTPPPGTVTSVFGRGGAVVALDGDYSLDLLGDVDLTTTAPVNGDVLRYNGTAWVPGAGGGSVPDASETVKGIVELATAAETTAGTSNVLAVHPAGLKVELDKKAPLASPALTGTPTAPTAAAATNNTQIATTAFVKNQVATGVPAATEGVAGVAELATQAEVDGGLDDARIVTPLKLKVKVDAAIAAIPAQPDASETVKGIVELATAAETTTGTSNTLAVHPAGLKVELDKKANLASPTFTGIPAAPTATAGTSTTQLATTAFVSAAVSGVTPPSATELIQGIVELATAAETTTGTDNTRAVHPAGLKVELDKKAPLASPALTGVPTAPTAVAGTNTAQLATTAFVSAAITAIPGAGDASETVKGIVELATAAETTTGTDNTRAVHPAGLKVELDKKAPLASPALTGVPTAPTAAAGTATTQLATTAFVGSAITAAAVPVASETVQGKVELATEAETTAGTDNTRAVHPAGLKTVTDAERTTSDAKYVEIAGDTMTGNLTVPSINNGPLAGFRNAIINGNFDIWQRGTSHVLVGFGANGYGSADRWAVYAGDATIELSRQPFTLGQTNVPGNPSYFARCTVTGTTATNTSFRQFIEGVSTFAGQQITLSFWAKADASKSIWIGFIQNFGSGGSPSTSERTNGQIITLSTSWTRYTLTETLSSISGKTLGSDGNDCLVAYFIVSDSTSGNPWSPVPTQTITFDVAQVQVEAGPVATPFERRPIGTEFALCQRYYQQGASPRGYLGDGTGTVGVYLALPVQMRAAPIVDYTPNLGTNINVSSSAGYLNITGTVSGSAPARRIALDDVKLDAELEPA